MGEGKKLKWINSGDFLRISSRMVAGEQHRGAENSLQAMAARVILCVVLPFQAGSWQHTKPAAPVALPSSPAVFLSPDI